MRVRLLASLAALLLLGALPFAPAVAARSPLARAATAAHARCAHIYTPAFERRIAKEFPHQRVTASIIDVRTGCHYHLHRNMRITTASMIKAQIMGAVLLRAQDQHRGLTSYETSRIYPMIRYSYNCPQTCDLYEYVGTSGMDSFDRRFGVHHTENTPEYGATVTTANDRTVVADKMLHGGGPMHAKYRKIAWHYMSHVHPTQRWGITAGAPRGWSVALKNGFYPDGSLGWRVGSSGFVRNRSGSGYAITVMTDHDSSQFQGIHLVENVVRHATAILTTGKPAPRPVDRAVCVETYAGESWETVARKVGLPASKYADVRKVSGDNPDPLSGQRACNPTLRKK